MNRHPILTAFLIGLASTGLAACSSQGSGAAPGDSVVIAGTSHVIWKTVGGGFGPGIPPGASCHFEATYDLDVHAGSLSWSVCQAAGNDYTDPTAFSTVTGSRTLTADERAQATAAAAAVEVSNRTTCGADLDSRSLDVNGTSGSITYGDDFYACEKMYDQYVFSDELANLRSVLDGMAHNP
jgi:hypothetical protein